MEPPNGLALTRAEASVFFCEPMRLVNALSGASCSRTAHRGTICFMTTCAAFTWAGVAFACVDGFNG